MPEKIHRLYVLPDDAPAPVPSAWQQRSFSGRSLDRVLAVQRPLVVAHIRSIRLCHPHATPHDIVGILQTRYLAAVTTGGAAVGATAVVPGIGTGVTLALSGAETLGFMESTALFAQSVAEVHGIAVSDPERARALVMALMLGKEGIDLVSQLAKQAAGKGGTRSSYWGELVTKSLPRAAVGPLVDRLKTAFIRQFAARGGASFLGKALPFGVGAVVGGAGNHLLGRRVLSNSRRAFGAAPPWLPPELEPEAGSEKLERRMLDGARRLGAGVTSRLGRRGRRADAEGSSASGSSAEIVVTPAPDSPSTSAG
ncbi:hypothetical protein [Microbacterium suwonense]|uniref:Di-and tripeptidase n=1 Tax=Microbacterium suwonense TaxID=683047 RepID=A0ABM8FQZ7_9MICO|nr:hypothetical protein [Microbacterium suwonense]BDZ37753.1 hypothetical protein GCM10025863_03670 [Microbacterium suwonense]